MIKRMYAIAGPARSGKDYLASQMMYCLKNKVKVQKLALAEPLRHMLRNEYPELVEDVSYEMFKDTSRGTEMRIRMLSLSNYFKDLFGPDVFIKALMHKIVPDTQVIIITDLGNDYEKDQLNKRCWKSGIYFNTIQLERPGYSYINEIYRTPITNPHWNITFDDIPKMAKILTNWV